MTVGIAAGMALIAAVLFAIAAVMQNVAVVDVVRVGPTPTPTQRWRHAVPQPRVALANAGAALLLARHHPDAEHASPHPSGPRWPAL
jgi:hypothetical protein